MATQTTGVSHDLARALLAVGLARVGFGSLPLLLVLRAHEATGSFAWAGSCVTVFAVGSAALAPPRGALVDRYGSQLPLTAMMSVFSCASAVMAFTDSRTALLVCAAAAGAAAPPLSASLSHWLAEQNRSAALLTRQSAIEQSAMATGPLVAGAVFTAFAGAGLLAAPACLVAALITGGRLLDRPRPPAAAVERQSASGKIRLALLTYGLIGFTLGGLEVSVPAATVDVQAVVAGLGMSLFAVGGVAGVAVRAAVIGRSAQPPCVTWPWTLGLGACVAGCAVAPSLIALLSLLVLAGACSGIAISTALVAVSRAKARVSDYAWTTTMANSGLALGAAAAGTMVDVSGFEWGFAIAATAAILATIAPMTLASGDTAPRHRKRRRYSQP